VDAYDTAAEDAAAGDVIPLAGNSPGRAEYRSPDAEDSKDATFVIDACDLRNKLGLLRVIELDAEMGEHASRRSSGEASHVQDTEDLSGGSGGDSEGKTTETRRDSQLGSAAQLEGGIINENPPNHHRSKSADALKEPKMKIHNPDNHPVTQSLDVASTSADWKNKLQTNYTTNKNDCDKTPTATANSPVSKEKSKSKLMSKLSRGTKQPKKGKDDIITQVSLLTKTKIPSTEFDITEPDPLVLLPCYPSPLTCKASITSVCNCSPGGNITSVCNCSPGGNQDTCQTTESHGDFKSTLQSILEVEAGEKTYSEYDPHLTAEVSNKINTAMKNWETIEAASVSESRKEEMKTQIDQVQEERGLFGRVFRCITSLRRTWKTAVNESNDAI